MRFHSKALFVLDVVTFLLLISAVCWVLFVTPMEAVMGAVQKVFYFHVANLWVGMLGFLVAAIAGVVFLWNRERIWDILGLAAIEISTVFFFIGIVTGSIWARPVWNTWWTWDPRLTTATIVELLYAAYLLLRQGIEDPERRARFGAVYAILSFISVPLTFFSIRLMRTIHPVVIGESVGGEGAFNMSPAMLRALLFCLFTYSVFFTDLMWHRILLEKLAEKYERLRLKSIET